jgi:hypothetical protein
MEVAPTRAAMTTSEAGGFGAKDGVEIISLS